MRDQPPSAVIAGAGLGGLLSGAYLARAGYRVELFEPLAFVGGKFTSFDRDGFAVPTGAFHTLPGGGHGPIARACARLGVDLQLHLPRPSFVVRRGDERFVVSKNVLRPNTFWQTLPRRGRWRLGAAIGALAAGPVLPDVTFEQWLRRWDVPADTLRIAGRIIEFSIGVPLGETSVRDLGCGMWSQRWHTEGVVRGGVKSITSALADIIRAHGGHIHLRQGVRRVLVSGRSARGVVTESGQIMPADVVVLGTGLGVAADLLGNACPAALRHLLARSVPAWGASISVRSRQPLVPHAGIEVPLDSRHVSGYIQISAGAPELAPPGWHYLLAYQVLRPETFTPARVAAGVDEVRALFPSVAPDDVFHVSVFRGRWPAARLAQGIAHHGRGRCPVVCPGLDGLYLVSHDSAGDGFAAEVVASAAATMARHLGLEA